MSTDQKYPDAKASDEQKRKEQQQLLHTMFQRMGAPNPWLEQQLPLLMDAGRKNADLQAAIQNVMGDIQRLMVQGNSPANRAALGAAADKLQGLANRADALNTSGSTAYTGAERAETGGVRSALTGAETAVAARGNPTNNSEFSTGFAAVKDKYRDKHSSSNNAKDQGSTVKDSQTPSSGQKPTTQTDPASAETTNSLKDRLNRLRDNKTPDSSTSNSTLAANVTSPQHQSPATDTEKSSPSRNAEPANHPDVPNLPSPRAEGQRAGALLKGFGVDTALTEGKPESPAAKAEQGSAHRPPARTAAVSGPHPGMG